MKKTPDQTIKTTWSKPRGTARTIFGSALLLTKILLLISKSGFSAEATNTEIKNTFTNDKKNPAHEWTIKEIQQDTGKKTINIVGGNDNLDPYDQIKAYVDTADTSYFNQLQKHIETKDSIEQLKCKAVIYAILQDTSLTEDQRHILALAYFDRLTKMPWSKYTLRLAGNKKYGTDVKYAERRNYYSAYKDYLELLDLKEQTEKIKEQTDQLNTQTDQLNIQTDQLNTQTDQLNTQTDQLNTQTDQLNTQTDQLNIQTNKLRLQNQILQQLLNGFKNSK